MTAVSAAPARSLEQRMTALELANTIRIERSRQKRKLSVGLVKADDVIQEPGDVWASCRVEAFLTCLPRVGVAKARQLMKAAGIAPTKMLGGLTQRQRDALCSEIQLREQRRFGRAS